MPCAFQIALLLAAVGVAARGEVDWTHQPFLGPNELGLRIENYLLLVAFALALVAVVRAKGHRWLATSLLLLQLWLLACAHAVAGMAL